MASRPSSETPSLPSPDGLGWDLTDGTTIEIVWTEGELMLQELADIVVDAPSQPQQVEDKEDQGELEFDNLLDIILKQTRNIPNLLNFS